MKMAFVAAAMALAFAAPANARFIFNGTFTGVLGSGTYDAEESSQEPARTIDARGASLNLEIFDIQVDAQSRGTLRVIKPDEFAIGVDGLTQVSETLNGEDYSLRVFIGADFQNIFAVLNLSGRYANGTLSRLSGNVVYNRQFFPEPSFETLNGTVAGFASVPEPATWAMMIGGFGMIGAALRRRARVNVGFA